MTKSDKNIILLIDKNKNSRETIQAFLKTIGYQCILAQDTSKAMEVVKEYDILFADVHKNMRDSAEDVFEMDIRNCEGDGVHFTERGNKKCGESIAKVILQNL